MGFVQMYGRLIWGTLISPENSRKSVFVTIHKKGSIINYKNCRTIALVLSANMGF